jgi:hypothetical protein
MREGGGRARLGDAWCALGFRVSVKRGYGGQFVRRGVALRAEVRQFGY